VVERQPCIQSEKAVGPGFNPRPGLQKHDPFRVGAIFHTSFISRRQLGIIRSNVIALAGRFRRPRTIVISVIIVVLSVGIVFATLPLLQHPTAPHGSLTTLVTQTVAPGNSTHPGHTALRLPGLPTNESFAIGIAANGTANFCITQDIHYASWVSSGTPPTTGGAFPFSCIFQEQTTQDILTFTPSISGDWDVVAFNTSQKTISVQFSPA
jgi:hypothetical protein